MTTDEIIVFCDKNPIIQELVRKYHAAREDWEMEGNPPGAIEFQWGRLDAFKDSIDCAMHLALGNSDANLRDKIIKLFKPEN